MDGTPLPHRDFPCLVSWSAFQNSFWRFPPQILFACKERKKENRQPKGGRGEFPE